MNSIRVSPKFTGEKLVAGGVEDQIEVYEDRTRGWFLDHARSLAQVDHSWVAALHLAVGYFESHMIFRTGARGPSEIYFVRGFCNVFTSQVRTQDGDTVVTPTIEDIARVFWEDVRCGLYHSGMTRFRVLLGGSAAVSVIADKTKGTVEAIVVNPAKFVAAIEKHFGKYVVDLKAAGNTELRKAFATAWLLYNPLAPLTAPLHLIGRPAPLVPPATLGDAADRPATGPDSSSSAT